MRIFFLLLITFFFVGISTAQNLPVTDRPINNADDIFRFAVVSDRTGGMRGGVFAGAMAKVELMQPEFVLSVGDLIDGYTEDPEVWNAQWDEFDAIVNQLSMPFYYVPGNHDTSNELLTEVWRERHGRDYYHFVYKDVLFLAINTDEVEGGGIASPQIEYFKSVLEENREVRWTLIFMHRPVWSYGDRMGYDEIEKALGDRNYTLFSGHHHHYRYKIQNGMEHFTLATTGGGSWMRNPDVGELDHITWVTMKEDGPEVAHIDINGIYGKNLVPKEDYADIQVLRQGNWLEIEPIVYISESFTEMPVTLKVKNNSERTLMISGNLQEQNGVRFEPSELEVQLESRSTELVEVLAKSIETESSIPDLNNNPIELELTAGFEREGRNNVVLSTSKRLLLDWVHSSQKVTSSIRIDGNVAEWVNTEWIDVRNPQFFYEGWDWNGEDDGRFEFSTRYDDHHFYVAIRFFDQRLLTGNKLGDRQDKFYVHIESDSKTEKIDQFEIAWKGQGKEVLSNSKLISAAISEESNSQIAEIKIPFQHLEAGARPKRIRLNIGVMDHDRPENTKPSVLWWRPVWGSDADFQKSGLFNLLSK